MARSNSPQDEALFSAGPTRSRGPARNNRRNAPRTEPNEFWVNVGFTFEFPDDEGGTRELFASIGGFPADGLIGKQIGGNSTIAQHQRHILERVQEKLLALEAGDETVIGLQTQIRRINDPDNATDDSVSPDFFDAVAAI